MKQPLKENYQRFFGENSLNELGYPDQAAIKIATQIKRAAKGTETDMVPLLTMTRSIRRDIRSGDAVGELKSRLTDVDKYDYYVQTSELTGFVVFNPDPIWDGSIYEVYSDEGGSITANLSKNWKAEIRKHK